MTTNRPSRHRAVPAIENTPGRTVGDAPQNERGSRRCGDANADVLAAAHDGERGAVAELVRRFYPDLQRLARSKLRVGDSLEPAGLVSELFEHLMRAGALRIDGPHQFFGLAACTMTNIVLDQRRRESATKRGACEDARALVGASSHAQTAELVQVGELLLKLAEVSQRQAHVVALHVFEGLAFAEIATELGISVRTAYNEWSSARAWFVDALGFGARDACTL